MKAIILLIATASAAVSLTTSASSRPTWANEGMLTERVQFGDLDLTSPKGRAKLERRISSAAYRICLKVDGASPAPPPTDPACYIETLTRARAQMEQVIARVKASNAIASADRR
jgi:UrcA family protein